MGPCSLCNGDGCPACATHLESVTLCNLASTLEGIARTLLTDEGPQSVFLHSAANRLNLNATLLRQQAKSRP